MPTDRVVEYDNPGIPKLFSIELLRRKRDIEGLLAMVFMASLLPLVTKRCEESDVTALTDSTIDRQYPFPIYSKIEQYLDDVWQQINRGRKLMYSTEILGIPCRVFVRIG